jgi:hypothetical protein
VKIVKDGSWEVRHVPYFGNEQVLLKANTVSQFNEAPQEGSLENRFLKDVLYSEWKFQFRSRDFKQRVITVSQETGKKDLPFWYVTNFRMKVNEKKGISSIEEVIDTYDYLLTMGGLGNVEEHGVDINFSVDYHLNADKSVVLEKLQRVLQFKEKGIKSSWRKWAFSAEYKDYELFVSPSSDEDHSLQVKLKAAITASNHYIDIATLRKIESAFLTAEELAKS